jgi:hypothetical protein
MTEFGLGSKIRNIFTAYGVIQDQRTGREIEAKSIFEARLGKVAPDAFQKGELQGHEYAMNSVVHYDLFFDNSPIFEWDLFNSVWRVKGVDQNADTNRILRIPGTN